jgi:hypothetical protein
VAVTDLLSGRFTHLDLGVAHVGRVSLVSSGVLEHVRMN